MTTLRIVYLGRRCEFSRWPLEVLLQAGLSVVGVIIPAPPALAGPAPDIELLEPPALPLLPADIVGLAHAAGRPAYAVRRLRGADTLAALAALQPDVLCAACFPRRLPPEWLALPPVGALNVHPARLPAYRGPEPLFWQFRAGEVRPGVTVHRMDPGFDTGPLLAQTETPWPDGLSEPEAERLTAQAGGRLLVDVLRAGVPAGWPQPEQGASYNPRPGAEDLIIPTDWPARRAFNFMRGAAGWGPFEIVGAGRRWRTTAALAFTSEPPPYPPPEPAAVWVPFASGAVLVKI